MQMIEGTAPAYPMDMMDMGPPPPQAGYGGMGPAEMMHPTAGPPGPQQHPRMMPPTQQQQQSVGQRGAHLMNSAEMMGPPSAPHDQMSPWFDSDM